MKSVSAAIACFGALGALLFLALPAYSEDAPVAGPESVEVDEAGADTRASEAPGEPPLITEANALLLQNTELGARVRELTDQSLLAEGEDRLIMERKIIELKLDYLKLVGHLVDNLIAQERAGLDAAELRRTTEAEFEDLGAEIVRHILASESKLKELRAGREAVDVEHLAAFEQKIEAEEIWLTTLYRAYVEHHQRLVTLGMDAAKELEDIKSRLLLHAETLGGRVRLASEQLARLRIQVTDKPDDAAIKAELADIERRKEILTTGLQAVVKMMNEVELDASEYQQLLITSTGAVTTDIFRAKVAIGLVEQGAERIKVWFLDFGPTFFARVVLFLFIMAAFKLLSVVVRRIVERAFMAERFKASQLLRRMSVSLLSNAILFVGLLVGLSQLGLELGPVLAGLGVAGFIVGFALQDSLSNFAAGMMILGYRPFDVGDLIEAGGVFGTVHHMSLVSTMILTIDNQMLIVPNAKIWGDVIKNVTHQDRRRVDMKFRVSYADDVEQAENVLMEILRSHPKVLKEPEPMVRLHELGDNAMNFVVRPWVEREDYWPVYWEVTREVKRRFDAEGISIPLPRRDVRLVSENGKPSPSQSG